MGLHVAGRDIDDPMAMWRAYASDYPRTIRCYDLAPQGDPGILTPEEAWRSRIINSRLTASERNALGERAKPAPWARVPPDPGLAPAGTPRRAAIFTAPA